MSKAEDATPRDQQLAECPRMSLMLLWRNTKEGKEAAHRVITENVHLGITNRSTTSAHCGACKELVKERHAQTKLKSSTNESVRLKTESEAWNWWRKKPVTGV